MLKKFLIAAIVIVAFLMVSFLSGKLKNGHPIETNVKSEETYEPVVVLELFTSQGCSSCPAADRLLSEMKKLHPESIFTLSYHVDYWNYIGWKDPFSKAVFSEKQSSYNKKLNYRGNYTPEIVVNGQTHFTGSNRAKMNAAIAHFGSKNAENLVSITRFEQKNGQLAFDYGVEGDIAGKNLRAVLVLDHRTTEVKRGENRNRTITNSTIVVAENTLDLVKNAGGMKIDLPEVLQANEKLSLVLLISNANLDITGAAQTSFVL